MTHTEAIEVDSLTTAESREPAKEVVSLILELGSDLETVIKDGPSIGRVGRFDQTTSGDCPSRSSSQLAQTVISEQNSLAPADLAHVPQTTAVFVGLQANGCDYSLETISPDPALFKYANNLNRTRINAAMWNPEETCRIESYACLAVHRIAASYAEKHGDSTLIMHAEAICPRTGKSNSAWKKVKSAAKSVKGCVTSKIHSVCKSKVKGELFGVPIIDVCASYQPPAVTDMRFHRS